MTLDAAKTIVLALALASAPTLVRAQHDARPAPDNHASHGNGTSCGQNSQAAVDLLDAAAARIDKSKDASEPATLRTALDDVELTLWNVKRKLADCLMLSGVEHASGDDHDMPRARASADHADDSGAATAHDHAARPK
jgi:hypothetical protein